MNGCPIEFSASPGASPTQRMLASKGLKPDAKASKHMKAYIKILYEGRNKFFGNARSIRKMAEKAYRNHELRMADMSKEKRTKAVMAALKLVDVEEFSMTDEMQKNRPHIGYKFGD